MRLRSLLFVPGDRPERMQKAQGCGADALILDLEDAVAAGSKEAARTHVASFLRSATRPCPLFVRINPLSGDAARKDLAAVLPHGPDGIVLPKCLGAGSVRQLGELMSAPTPILPIATETPAAVLRLSEFAAVADRLIGLTWGVADLSAAIGARSTRRADGSYTPPFEVLRSLALFAAHAAGVPAIDTVFPAFRDAAGFARHAAEAVRDGFDGMLAIHPDQVPIIHAAFTPDDESIEAARRVVAAFRANPGAGVVAVDGRMLDAPHLAAAERLLARAAG